MNYKIRTEVFEGPLDLLLQLIEKRKLHISDVSLGEITDDYLSFIERGERFPMDSVANFTVVASTLVLIKSRSLLPTLILTEDEEESTRDLEARLKEYKKFKELSVFVQENFGKRSMYQRKQSHKIVPIFSPTPEMTREGIFEAIKSVIKSLPKKEAIPQVVIKKIVSLEDMVESLTERVTTALSLSFKDFSKSKAVKIEVVVSFLAMLELVKRGVINVKQSDHFDDIYMETKETGVPQYY